MEPLLQLKSLDAAVAGELMAFLTDGSATEAQIAAALTALRLKGCTGEELAAFAEVLRDKANLLSHDLQVVDTCGTGGGIPSFNISTGAAIVASAAGVVIAKHGNRGVTSFCGSADVLEELGVRFDHESPRLVEILTEAGIVFMFAQHHHPALRHVGKTRRELGFRTVFNQLGPLANPARAQRQLLGVYDAAMLRPMAEALSRLGSERAIVAIGQNGLDEISPCGATFASIVDGGQMRLEALTPESFGLDELDPTCLEPGETLKENADILREALAEPKSPRSRAILPSAAAAIWIAGLEEDFPSAAALARKTVEAGLATAKLEQLIEVSNRP